MDRDIEAGALTENNPHFLDSTLQELFFLNDGEDPETNIQAATRNGGAAVLRRQSIWNWVCQILDEAYAKGLDNPTGSEGYQLGLAFAHTKITPTVVLDFSFCDVCGRNCSNSTSCKIDGMCRCRPNQCCCDPRLHMNFRKADGLLERGWVFELHGLASNIRLILHGHTFRKWSTRGEIGVDSRADELTSVNWRIAEFNPVNRTWSQDSRGNECLPLKRDVPWRQHYTNGSHEAVIWKWREGRDDEEGFPQADLVGPGNRVDDNFRQVYRRVQTLLRLIESTDYEETSTIRGFEKAIRSSHGQVVQEMDITHLARRSRDGAYLADLAHLADASSSSLSSETGAEWIQPNWSTHNLPTPAQATWPFKILFVGVNSSENVVLDLKKEYEKIKSAHREEFNRLGEGDRPLLIPIQYSTWTEVMSHVGHEYPTILHFGCHAQGNGLQLFGEMVQPQQMILAIQQHNDFAHGEGLREISVIVVNACESDEHAKKLSVCVDFSIGHQGAVEDGKAIEFTGSFYSNIFKGMNLAGSLNSARSVSSQRYQLHAKKDPQKFRLKNPTRREKLYGFSMQMFQAVSCLLSLEAKNVLPDEVQSDEQQSLETISFPVPPNGWQSEEQLSQEGTPKTASPRTRETLGFYNKGVSHGLHQHVKDLLKEFNTYYCEIRPDDDESYYFSDLNLDIQEEFSGYWTFCMLLWVLFVGGANVSKETAGDLKQCLEAVPKQEDLLPKIDEYIKTGKVGNHVLLDKIGSIVENDKHSSSRPVAAIAVLDCMVQEHLTEGEKQKWMAIVVRPWYESSDLHAHDVLRRANIFLRNSYEGIGGIKILLKAFENGSYAVFMTMPSLASLLFFQHLELRKLECMQSGKAGSASAAGVAVASASLLHGFKLCVSSGGRVFHTADTDRPTRNMPAIIQGLRCLAHLRDSDWEMLGPVKTARDFLQEEQCVEQGELWANPPKNGEDECETARDLERVYIYIYIFIVAHVYVAYIYLFIYIQKYMHVCTYIYIHIYIYICMAVYV